MVFLKKSDNQAPVKIRVLIILLSEFNFYIEVQDIALVTASDHFFFN